jgi:uncharacterized cupredoxin-like copper-binding protein
MPRIKLSSVVVSIGVLLLFACAARQAKGQVNPDGFVNVDVRLKDFSIESSVTEFKPGVAYHFTVTNEGQVAHEFMILPVSEHMGMSGMPMEEYDKMALMMIPIEQLPVGASVKTDYTFSEVADGKIELIWMTPGHFEAGMHIPITVK